MGDLVGGAEAQLALEHAHHVGGHAGVEPEAAVGPGGTSPSSHSRTASASSAADGPSWGAKAPPSPAPSPAGAVVDRCRAGCRSVRCQEREHVVLVLAGAPADGGELDRAGQPEPVRRRLDDADHAPTKGAVDLPPPGGVGIDGLRRRPPRRRPRARRGHRTRPPADRRRRSARPARRTSRGPRAGRRGGRAPSRARPRHAPGRP